MIISPNGPERNAGNKKLSMRKLVTNSCLLSKTLFLMICKKLMELQNIMNNRTISPSIYSQEEGKIWKLLKNEEEYVTPILREEQRTRFVTLKRNPRYY